MTSIPSGAGRWERAGAGEVVPGDRVRVGGDGGVEVSVSRVEPSFLGRADMIAFIEDTPDRWLKVPVPSGGQVEVAHLR